VVDVAGLNSVSTAILSNAAGAMHGMVLARAGAGDTPAGSTVRWCRLTVSKLVLKAPMVSALEATI